MKGVIAAGGSGSRLHPLTLSVSKHLLPVYDKPMIYHPLTTLMLSGIREILVVVSPEHLAAYQKLLGDGNRWGLRISYATQAEPKGIADILGIAEDFLDGNCAALILGDNIFHGEALPALLQDSARHRQGATIFCHEAADVGGFGVVELDPEGRPRSIEEKPVHPKSNLAVTGLYFYERGAATRAKTLTASTRGELEITDLNRTYLAEGRLRVVRLGRDVVWLDAGTAETLFEAARCVQGLEERLASKIACPEEVALRMGYIDETDFRKLAEAAGPSQYGAYLRRVLARLR
jgi:glucose-1-phosphate thymidylyltransferase